MVLSNRTEDVRALFVRRDVLVLAELQLLGTGQSPRPRRLLLIRALRAGLLQLLAPAFHERLALLPELIRRHRFLPSREGSRTGRPRGRSRSEHNFIKDGPDA